MAQLSMAQLGLAQFSNVLFGREKFSTVYIVRGQFSKVLTIYIYILQKILFGKCLRGRGGGSTGIQKLEVVLCSPIFTTFWTLNVERGG